MEKQPKYKVCIRCKKEKPLEEFHHDKRSEDGYRSYCKECVSEMLSPHRQVKNLDGETWKDIEGYEGVYYVSNFGRIKHVINQEYSRLRIPYPATNGYLRLVLSYKGRRTTISVHREVAKAFIDNPMCYETVNHIDFDKTNNTVENLEWTTIRENINHAKINGKNNRKPILQCDKDWNVIREWESAFAVEKELGYFSTLISRVCRGKQKFHKGYKWVFKHEKS